jgi:hypothetical protein
MTFIKKISFAFVLSGMICMSLTQYASSEETFASGDPRYQIAPKSPVLQVGDVRCDR